MMFFADERMFRAKAGDETIRLAPNLSAAYANRGTVYHNIGNLDKANADFATAKLLKAAQ
jgi:hypothetical protein